MTEAGGAMIQALRILGMTAALALGLGACASMEKLDAANDVHHLLLSIRDNDRAAFDAHVDRRALEREIEARLLAEARASEKTRGWAALLAPSLAKLAGDALIQPGVFRLVAERYGYTPATKIPPPVALASALRPLPDGRMCATRKKDGPCVLMFTKEGDAWKLSGFQGDMSELRL